MVDQLVPPQVNMPQQPPMQAPMQQQPVRPQQ